MSDRRAKVKHLTQVLERDPQSSLRLISALGPLGEAVTQEVRAAVEASFATALEKALTQSSGPALLDRRGLAHALNIGVDTVDRLRREGCPELTVGDAPRFELENVLAWLRSRGQASKGASHP